MHAATAAARLVLLLLLLLLLRVPHQLPAVLHSQLPPLSFQQLPAWQDEQQWQQQRVPGGARVCKHTRTLDCSF
jgi:hypothetical protein